MAYGKKPTKKSSEAYEKFKADLKAGNIGCCYLFHGEESYLREHYLEQLRKTLVPAGFEEFNYHRLEGKDLTDDLLEYIIRVANGEQTKNEINGCEEIAIFKDGVTL